MSDRARLRFKILAAFGSATLVLLAAGAFSYRTMGESRDSQRWVQHTQEVLGNLQELVSAVLSIETSSRGFVLTGDEINLETYRASIARSKERVATLRALTADNHEQQQQLPALEELAAKKIQFADINIGVRRAEGLGAAADAMRSGPGRRIMSDFLMRTRAVQDVELHLFAQREADATRAFARSRIGLILGTLLGVLSIVGAGLSVWRDARKRWLAEASLFIEKDLAQTTLNSIGDAVVCTGPSGDITYLNTVAERMTGWSSEEAIERPMAEVLQIVNSANHQTIPDPMSLAIEQNRTMHLPPDSLLIRRDGVEIPIEDAVAPIHDVEGSAVGAVMVFSDESESRAMRLQMTHSAAHDFLTGLPNRMLLDDRINQAIALAPRHGKKVAILVLDLDGFKHVNDSLGHTTGDKLLKSVSNRLVECVRASDTVSRTGGDEFVVVLSELQQLEDASGLARRILTAVAQPHFIDQHDLHVTTSIGISIYPDDGIDAETLIKTADTAMYQAKGNGRHNYQFFEPAMNVRAVERQFIEEGMRRGLERNEFTLHYQPKVCLRTGAITGAEALARWIHPDRGSISPAQFIPVAEDSGLIVQIGAWVLRKACQQARAWEDAGLANLKIAVNVSAVEFQDESFPDRISVILRETGLDPRLLELEITESVLMKRAESTASILRTLREKGIKIAIDDFGTGYSSLSYLRKFPVDILKIDQSFVRLIGDADDQGSMVTAVIAMARTLKLHIVAEGVETAEEAKFLRSHQCDEAQGYFFSPPLPPKQFARRVAAGSPVLLDVPERLSSSELSQTPAIRSPMPFPSISST